MSLVGARARHPKEDDMSTTQSVRRPDVGSSAAPQRRTRRPSSAWYAVGASVAAIGVSIALVWGFMAYTAYRDSIQGFERMLAPGTAELVLGSGAQTIYVEGSGEATAGNVSITTADGTAVPTSDYLGDLRYDAPDGSVGRAIATVSVPATGTYQVSASGLTGTVAIGPSVSSSMIASAVGSVFLAFGSIAAGAVIVIVTAVRRSRADPIVIT
jgi:hypothetical protein